MTMTFYQPSGLTRLLRYAVARTPEGDSFSLRFSWRDYRGGQMALTIELLNELAEREGIRFRAEPRWPNTLRITRLPEDS